MMGLTLSTFQKSRETAAVRARTGSGIPLTETTPPGTNSASAAKLRLCAWTSAKFALENVFFLPSFQLPDGDQNEGGWLAFQSPWEEENRRLSPIPSEWENSTCRRQVPA